MIDFQDPKNVATLLAVEKKLIEVLEQVNRVDKPEAAIAAFAAIRVARGLLDKYNPTTRAALLEAIIPFLEHAKVKLGKKEPGRILTFDS